MLENQFHLQESKAKNWHVTEKCENELPLEANDVDCQGSSRIRIWARDETWTKKHFYFYILKNIF